MSYDKANLAVTRQGISKFREFIYEDTGGEAKATYEGAGWFTDAGDKGAAVNDVIRVHDIAGAKQYRGYFSAASDTGSTQGTAVLDTD